MASLVELDPEPATMGTRPFACSMHHSTTFICSSCERVGLSPVVPTGTSPLVPSAICQSTSSRNAFSSREPFLNGVTNAVNEPRKLDFAAAMAGSLTDRKREYCYRLGWGCERAGRIKHDRQRNSGVTF